MGRVFLEREWVWSQLGHDFRAVRVWMTRWKGGVVGNLDWGLGFGGGDDDDLPWFKLCRNDFFRRKKRGSVKWVDL